MRKDFILFGAIFFFIASFLNVAMARNSPNIFNKDTGEVISVRHGASFMFTFNPDGSNFNFVREITGYAYFNAITYGNNTYVAVADDATIWYSKNNGKWTEATLSGHAAFQAVEYGDNGRFVAVATEGTIWYSDDGANWTESLSPDLELYDPNFYEVIYANRIFVAVGVVMGPVTAIFTSTDGESWYVASIGPDNLPGIFESIAYGNNTFVAVGTNGSIYMSNDNAKDWNNVSLPKNNNPYLDNDLYAVTYGKGVFVAVGDNASIWYSNNGTNWALASGIEQSSMTFSSVTYGNGVFVAAIGDTGWNLTDKTIWSSTDGVNWQAGGGNEPNKCASNVYSTFDSVDFFGDFFIATNRHPYTIAHYPEYYSTDGQNWSSVQQSMGGC